MYRYHFVNIFVVAIAKATIVRFVSMDTVMRLADTSGLPVPALLVHQTPGKEALLCWLARSLARALAAETPAPTMSLGSAPLLGRDGGRGALLTRISSFSMVWQPT